MAWDETLAITGQDQNLRLLSAIWSGTVDPSWGSQRRNL